MVKVGDKLTKLSREESIEWIKYIGEEAEQHEHEDDDDYDHGHGGHGDDHDYDHDDYYHHVLFT